MTARAPFSLATRTAGEFAPRSLLKRSQFAQAVLDVLAIGFLAAFASLFGLAIALAFFILLFVGF